MKSKSLFVSAGILFAGLAIPALAVNPTILFVGPNATVPVVHDSTMDFLVMFDQDVWPTFGVADVTVTGTAAGASPTVQVLDEGFGMYRVTVGSYLEVGTLGISVGTNIANVAAEPVLAPMASVLTQVAVAQLILSPNAEAGGQFGYGLSVVPDLNSNGAKELLVGAPSEDPGSAPDDAGRAYLIDSTTKAVLHTFASPNEQADGGFGKAVSWVPDIDGDTIPDLVVGSSDLVSGLYGRVYLFSGSDKSLIGSLASPAFYDQSGGGFGFPVLGIPDVNGDGRGEIVVGAPSQNSYNGYSSGGRIYCFDGATFAVIREYGAGSSIRSAQLSASIAAVPDATLDGIDDLVVGAPNAYQFGSGDTGYFNLVDFTQSGSFVVGGSYPRIPAQDDMGFGRGVAGIADITGDGKGEVAIGAPNYSGAIAYYNTGRVEVYSAGQSAGYLRELISPQSSEAGAGEFGRTLHGTPDWNGDGKADLLVTARNENSGTGRVWVMDPTGGGAIQSFTSPDGGTNQGFFGSSLGVLPDRNGNGIPEAVIAAYAEDTTGPAIVGAGRVHIFPGYPSALDSVRPTVSFPNATATYTYTNAPSFDLRIQFSEDTGSSFSLADITLDAPLPLPSLSLDGSATSYTLTITPSDPQASLTVRTTIGMGFNDPAGNPGYPGTSNFVVFDRTEPTVTVVIDQPTTTVLDTLTFGIDPGYSESGLLFDEDDIQVVGTLAGGATVQVTSPPGWLYGSVAVTLADPNANGTLGIVVQGTLTDLAGNPLGTAVASPLYTLDHSLLTTPPAREVLVSGGTAVWRVNTATGDRQIVTNAGRFGSMPSTPIVGTGDGFAQANGIVVENHNSVLVEDTMTNDFLGRIVRVDLATGNRTIVTDSASGSTGRWSAASTIVIGTDGALYLIGVNVLGGESTSKLIRVNLSTGSRSSNLTSPSSGTMRFSTTGGLVVLPDGRLVTGNMGTLGGLLVLDHAGASMTSLVSGPFVPNHLDVDGSGNIVAKLASGTIERIDPATGTRTVLFSNPNAVGPAVVSLRSLLVDPASGLLVIDAVGASSSRHLSWLDPATGFRYGITGPGSGVTGSGPQLASVIGINDLAFPLPAPSSVGVDWIEYD